MPSEESIDITGRLAAWGKGDEAALADVMPLVYDDLRTPSHAATLDDPWRLPFSRAAWRMRPISSWSTRAASDATIGPTSSRCVRK